MCPPALTELRSPILKSSLPPSGSAAINDCMEAHGPMPFPMRHGQGGIISEPSGNIPPLRMPHSCLHAPLTRKNNPPGPCRRPIRMHPTLTWINDCIVQCHDQPSSASQSARSRPACMHQDAPGMHPSLCPLTWIVLDQVLDLLVPQRLACEDEGDHRAAPHAGEELIHRVAPDGERPRGCVSHSEARHQR